MNRKILERVLVVLRAVTFWLGLIGAVLAAILAVLGTLSDDPIVAVLIGWLAPAAVVVATLVLIIRRVTEVIEAQHGLLPIDGPVTPKANV